MECLVWSAAAVKELPASAEPDGVRITAGPGPGRPCPHHEVGSASRAGQVHPCPSCGRPVRWVLSIADHLGIGRHIPLSVPEPHAAVCRCGATTGLREVLFRAAGSLQQEVGCINCTQPLVDSARSVTVHPLDSAAAR